MMDLKKVMTDEERVRTKECRGECQDGFGEGTDG